MACRALSIALATEALSDSGRVPRETEAGHSAGTSGREGFLLYTIKENHDDRDCN